MQIGNLVVVKDMRQTYSTHPHHKEYGCENFLYGQTPEEGSEGIIIAMPTINEADLACVIRINGIDYLINRRGVEVVGIGDIKINYLKITREKDYNESMRVFRNLRKRVGELIERGVHDTTKNRWKTVWQSLEYAICYLTIEDTNNQLKKAVDYYFESARENNQEHLLLDLKVD